MRDVSYTPLLHKSETGLGVEVIGVYTIVCAGSSLTFCIELEKIQGFADLRLKWRLLCDKGALHLKGGGSSLNRAGRFPNVKMEGYVGVILGRRSTNGNHVGVHSVRSVS